MSARFITFEGLDGSGKSTHLAQAAVWMAERALPVVVTHEPGGAPLCDAIRLLQASRSVASVVNVSQL